MHLALIAPVLGHHVGRHRPTRSAIYTARDADLKSASPGNGLASAMHRSPMNWAVLGQTEKV